MIRTLLITIALMSSAARPLSSQLPGHSPGTWRTIDTEHFAVHYPVALEAWATHVAERLESVRNRVVAVAGYSPEQRVHVVIDDPASSSGGSAHSFPALYLRPSPSPPPVSGDYSDWAEIVSFHEFAHLASVARPRRSGELAPLLRRLSPFPPEHQAPLWLSEGYATYVEAYLNGAGRSRGAFRAAVLRQSALEGRLPRYDELDRTDGPYATPYYFGSAFLEWLVARSDSASLPALWSRMSARERRDFDENFAGVFGAPPAELYGRFTVDLTERALAVHRALEQAGLNEGILFQRYTANPGAPTVSPDGQYLALEVPVPRRPSRIVVMSTTPDSVSTHERIARERALALDPHDVPAVPGSKIPQQQYLATLLPHDGRRHTSPAFMPDGERMLVVRAEPIGNGQVRPDLFVWTWRTGELRRVTEQAGVQQPAVAPDATWSAAIRCAGGTCDVVRIDLASGGVTVLASGSIDRPYAGPPAVSPDGAGVVASVQEGSRWRLVWIDADGSGNERPVDPDDDATRTDAAFLAGDRGLVAVSTRGGTHNIERLDPVSRHAEAITRVSGAAIAPAPNLADGSLFFLSLRAGGWDLRRLLADAPAQGPVVEFDPVLSPAVPLAFEDVAPATAQATPFPRPYGLGPRRTSWFPALTLAQHGKAAGLSITNADIVGRLSMNLAALWGDPSVWRGVGLRAIWRGMRPWLRASAFVTEQGEGGGGDQTGGVEYTGGSAALELRRDGPSVVHSLRLGGSMGRMAFGGIGDGTRMLGLAAYELSQVQSFGSTLVGHKLRLHATLGSTLSHDWRRATLATQVSVGNALHASAAYGFVDSDAPVFEQFTIGGFAPTTLDADLVPQRFAMPVLPTGTYVGDRLAVFRMDLGDAMVRPYFWAAATDTKSHHWHRMLGIEAALGIPPAPLVPFAGFDFVAGAAYLLNAPLAGRVRAYMGVSAPW